MARSRRRTAPRRCDAPLRADSVAVQEAAVGLLERVAAEALRRLAPRLDRAETDLARLQRRPLLRRRCEHVDRHQLAPGGSHRSPRSFSGSAIAARAYRG